MSDEELPEIVVPNDEVAVRARPSVAVGRAIEPSGWGLPPGRVWIVATDTDGTVYAYEIPTPDDVRIDTTVDFDDLRSIWDMTTRHVPRATTTTWKIVTTGSWTLRVFKPGEWQPS